MSETKRQEWDAIVIGSGLGGLSAAAYLCAAGKRTLVLESHYVAGGNAQVFRRAIRGRRYEFDVGVHYIGECGHDGLITHVFHGLGLAERVVFRPLDPDGYTTLHFPDFTFRIPTGWDRYRKRLLEAFPAEAGPLGNVVDVMRSVCEEAGRLAGVDMQDMASAAPTFTKWGLRPVTDLFAEYGISAQAQAVLLGEQGTYAVRPTQTPVVLAAGISDHFLHGAYYPEGGGQVLPGRLVEAIRAYGGEVRTRAPVGRVRIENGRVCGVTLQKDGEEIDAPVVISNADLKRTVRDLVGEEHFSKEIVKRVRGFRMGSPLFCVYLGLDIDLADRGMANTNHCFWGTYDIEGIYDELDAGRIPEGSMAFITTATLKDTVSEHLAPKGHTNLQIMSLAPKDYGIWGVEKGPAEGGSYHRDPVYRERKNKIMEELIDSADQLIPGIREHIDWKEAATPVSQERFTLSTGGTSYGIELTADQAGPLRLGPGTEVEGLFLCGASAPSGPGIAGVLRGGVVAAGEVLQTDLLGAVLAGEIFGDRDLLPELRAEWDAWRESH